MRTIRYFATSRVLYPQRYLLFIFLSLMDVLMTAFILSVGGWEVNALANRMFSRFDLVGLVVLKFCMVSLFLLVCELVGKRNHRTGGRLVIAAILITIVPLVVGSVELAAYAMASV